MLTDRDGLTDIHRQKNRDKVRETETVRPFILPEMHFKTNLFFFQEGEWGLIKVKQEWNCDESQRQTVLQCRTAFKIQNGQHGAPKWPMGSGRRANSGAA